MSARNLSTWRFGVGIAALILAVVLTVMLVGLWWLGLFGLKTQQGYFGAVFSPEGEQIYFVERRTSGMHWGMGWEHFSPPAWARVSRDSFMLQRLDLNSGEITTLERWQDSPLLGKTLRQYRGRLYSSLRVALEAEEDGVRYKMGIALPRQPVSERFQLQGYWRESDSSRGSWQPASSSSPGLGTPRILAERELFELPGEESFPAAILAYDHSQQSWTLLATTLKQPPSDAALTSLLQSSGKSRHDHQQTLARLQQQRLAIHREQGMSESDALLATYRDLSEMGYFPKPRRWVATLVTKSTSSALPVLEISEAEFQVGLMSDIAQALAEPGREVDKLPGLYVQHRDYDTSLRLNELMAAGNVEFEVWIGERHYHLQLLPAERPAITPDTGRRD
ncbi:hypothetical protein [Nitrincola alkalilacustris]|uniref:hypothetical protein n=1 Tax=Nitrincola alkalilacustris TaxID=1571224 RepID=UPI00124EE786|nr:hypothetical protein [Nitrincola alkalilacustris]